MENCNCNLEKVKSCFLDMKKILPNLIKGGVIMGAIMALIMRGGINNVDGTMVTLLYYSIFIGAPIFFGKRYIKTLTPETSFGIVEACVYSLCMISIGFVTSLIIGAIVFSGLTHYTQVVLYMMLPKVGDNSLLFIFISLISIIVCSFASAYFIQKKGEE